MNSTSATASESAPSRGPWKPVLLAALIASAPFAYCVWYFNWVCDDAFISFRYARNFAQGLGLRFNPETVPPVEGYTNFLWVLLMSVVERAHLDPVIWSRVLSITSAVCLMIWVTRFVQRVIDSNLAVLAAVSLFGVCLPSLGVWSTSGLAVMPMTLCLFGVYDSLLRDGERPKGIQAGVLAALAALMRADAIVYLAIILGLAFMTALLERRKQLARTAFMASCILGVCVAAHFAWRYSYYGDWLPNTARVKALGGDATMRSVRLERGIAYVATNFMTISSLILVPLASLVLIRTPDVRRSVMHGLLFLLGASAYAAVAGGDFMAFGRFLVPAVPFVLLLFASLASRLRVRSGTVQLGFLTAGCITLSLLPVFDLYVFPQAAFDRCHFRWNRNVATRQSEIQRWKNMVQNTQSWAMTGKILKLIGKDGDSIVHGSMGAIAYYSELYMYDTFGLTNLHWRKVDPPFERKSPGHDREMRPADFLEFEPTFLGFTRFVDEGAGPYEAFGGEADWKRRYPQRAAISKPEIHSLPPGFGFPEGRSICVLRFIAPD